MTKIKLPAMNIVIIEHKYSLEARYENQINLN